MWPTKVHNYVQQQTDARENKFQASKLFLKNIAQMHVHPGTMVHYYTGRFQIPKNCPINTLFNWLVKIKFIIKFLGMNRIFMAVHRIHLTTEHELDDQLTTKKN